MKFTLNYFSLQKLGNEEADYEDAFEPKRSGIIERSILSLAIADGATESSFASDWAKMLTRDFVRKPYSTIEVLKNRTRILSRDWHKVVNGKPLPWFIEEKIRLGAFTTFLGVRLTSFSKDTKQSGKWSAIAIGDSCIFQIRDDNLVYSFPISNSEEFTRTPALLSTNLNQNLILWKNKLVKCCSKRDWRTGDFFILATDALACWFLTQYENNDKPWNTLLKFTKDPSPSNSFQTWIDEVRRSCLLKNDDVTLLILRL